MRKSAFGVSNGLAASRLVNGGLAWLARKGLAAPNGLAASPLGNGLGASRLVNGGLAWLARKGLAASPLGKGLAASRLAIVRGH
jgi:hypothetical protein